MFENFDFSWFITIPGILTSLGCLLIIVAILIFISSALSKKKNKKEEAFENTSNDFSNVATEPIVDPFAMNNLNPNVTQMNETIQPVPVQVAPVNVEPQLEPVQVAPINVEPQIEPVQVTPVNVEPQLEPVLTHQNNLPYGGVNPIENPAINMVEPEVKPIYGGADPLQGTGVIPVVTQTPEMAEEIESL